MSTAEHREADILQLLDDPEPELQREGLKRIVDWLRELDERMGQEQDAQSRD